MSSCHVIWYYVPQSASEVCQGPFALDHESRLWLPAGLQAEFCGYWMGYAAPLSHWSTGMLLPFLIGPPVCHSPFSLVHRCVVPLSHWSTGMPLPSFIGSPVCCSLLSWVYRYAFPLSHWSIPPSRLLSSSHFAIEENEDGQGTCFPEAAASTSGSSPLCLCIRTDLIR